jgi:hypothetical protein
LATCLKLRSMNKNIRALEACKYLIFLILIAGLASCDKRGFTYDNVVDAGTTQFALTDSLTLNMSTAYLDSVPTSNTGTVLAGTNNDPVFGKISASSYWQVTAYGGSPAVPDLSTFDSLVLMLHPKAYAYGDTTKIQDLRVYRVTQPIQPYLNTSTLYSYNTFQTDPTPLGQFARSLSPSRDTVIGVRMPDDLGKQMLDLCYRRSQTITVQDQFNNFLEGICLKAGPNSNVITPFRADDSLNLRLFFHYTVTGGFAQTYIDFKIANPAVQFNHIDFTRPTGSPLASLSPQNKILSSTQTNNQVYAQPLTNIIARIDIPALRTFGQLHKYFKIMRATLTVRPIKTTYVYPYTLPPALTLTQIDQVNTVGVADSVISPTTGATQHGNLLTDFATNINTAYTYDITNYVISTMNSSDVTTRSLALMQPRQTGQTDFTRVILGDAANRTNNMDIQIYYVVYQ